MIINDFFTNPKRSARNVAENSQRVDSLVTDALRVMKGPEISDAVLALKRVLGDRAYNERPGFYSFYVKQIHRNWQLPMYGQQNLAEDADDYLDSDPATGTGDETHELDTGPLTQDPDADYDDMMQPMEATSAVPSPAAAAAATLDNTNDGPDIMRNWDRFGKNLKPDQEMNGLDSEEEEAVKNHIDRWQAKMKNLPDPFAGPTIYKGADGSEFVRSDNSDSSDAASDSGAIAVDLDNTAPEDLPPASNGNIAGARPRWLSGMTNRDYDKLVKDYEKQVGSGASGAAADSSGPASSIAPNGWQYVINPLFGQDKQPNPMGRDPAQQAQAARASAAKQQANSVPAGNAVSSSGKIAAPASKTAAPAAAKTTAPLWQTLAQANGIANPNLIYPGQQIKLPNGTFAEVEKGDTLSGIANRYRQGDYNDGDGTSSGLPANRRNDLTANRPRKSVKETDVGNTMDDGFKWGTASMPMQDGSTMQYHAPTNSYKQATPPTRSDLNTNISTISRDSSTNKNGQANQNYSDVSIATNPATGTGDYMHRQDVNGTPTTTFRQNVPAAELAKLRSQHFNEDINRMQNLAGIRKK